MGQLFNEWSFLSRASTFFGDTLQLPDRKRTEPYQKEFIQILPSAYDF